jgi:hypothetical protein
MRSQWLAALLACSLAVPLAAQEKPAPVHLKPLPVSPACTVAQDLGISRLAGRGLKSPKNRRGQCDTL